MNGIKGGRPDGRPPFVLMSLYLFRTEQHCAGLFCRNLFESVFLVRTLDLVLIGF